MQDLIPHVLRAVASTSQGAAEFASISVLVSLDAGQAGIDSTRLDRHEATQDCVRLGWLSTEAEAGCGPRIYRLTGAGRVALEAR